ncbi:MAG: ATP-binding protein [Acidimicrobiales bacterium]
MIFRQTFVGAPSSVPQARHFAKVTLSGLSTEVVDAATLMVSELVTNAIQHATSLFEVTIECDDAHLQIDVSDNGSGHPEARNPEVTDPHGRGLQIVGRLADTWGVRAPDGGWHKSVWFTLGLP